VLCRAVLCAAADGKTKSLVAALSKVSGAAAEKKVLLVLEQADAMVWRAGRNVDKLAINVADNVQVRVCVGWLVVKGGRGVRGWVAGAKVWADSTPWCGQWQHVCVSYVLACQHAGHAGCWLQQGIVSARMHVGLSNVHAVRVYATYGCQPGLPFLGLLLLGADTVLLLLLLLLRCMMC
jgi:hypothetical protein